MSSMALPTRVAWVLRISFLSVVLFSISFYVLEPHVHLRRYYESNRVPELNAKSAFVKGVVESEIDGPFDAGTLRALCLSKEWMPGLIFKCEAPKGGVAVVRNVFLNCVRFAVEAGATSFILPEMQAHSTTEDLTNPFSHYFDTAHFTSTLESACPQITLIPHLHDLWDKPTVAKPITLKPFEMGSEVLVDNVISKPSQWASFFHQYLNTTHPKPYSAEKPVLVSLLAPFLQWPLAYDDPHLVANFGKLLRYREDVRRLAGVVLHALDMKFNTGIEADKEGIRLGHFYGAHLRTELDAQAAGWTPYEIQSENYLTHAQNSQIKTIYLVSGNEEDAIRFRESAMEMGMQVATRDELLSEEGYEMDMQEMEVLSWDQKECVDYEVLLRARAMGGSHESTFAWNVALRRHVVDGQGVWVPVVDLGVERRVVEDEGEGGEVNEDDQSPNEEGNAEGEEDTPNEATSNTLQNSFQDSLSTIYGPGDEGMSIKVGMWP